MWGIGVAVNIGKLGLPYNSGKSILRSVTDLAFDTRRHGVDDDPSDLFSPAWFRRRGDRPALVFDDPQWGARDVRAITYAELADRIDMRRIELGREGCGKGSHP